MIFPSVCRVDSCPYFAVETVDNDDMQISSQASTTPAAQTAPATRVLQATSRQATRVDSSVARQADAPRRSSPDGAPAPDQMASNLARLDKFAESAMSRLENAVANAPEGEVTSFRVAAEALESGLSRLRDGMQNGTLNPEDVQRGIRNTFQNAREALDAARPSGDEAAASADVAPAGRPSLAPDAGGLNATGEAVRDRYQGFTDSILSRVASVEGMDSAVMDAVGEAASAFESATARLDQALFNPETGDSIDRGEFRELYDNALSQLQTQLSDLIGGHEAGSSIASMLYTAEKGVEGMNQGGFGLDVAG